MTPEELAAITAVGDAMRANPRPWVELTPQEQAVIVAVLKPDPVFTTEQRQFIALWWMQVNDTQVEQINAAMPANTRCVPRIDGEGRKWVSCDFFTDALEQRRLASVLPILQTLTLEYKLPSYWPVVEVQP